MSKRKDKRALPSDLAIYVRQESARRGLDLPNLRYGTDLKAVSTRESIIRYLHRRDVPCKNIARFFRMRRQDVEFLLRPLDPPSCRNLMSARIEALRRAEIDGARYRDIGRDAGRAVR